MVRKMGPVTYEIHHLDKGKTKQTYHVNLLKEWKVPPSKGPETSLLVKVEEESENAKRQPSVVSLTHLEDSKRKELQHLRSQFSALFCQRPGRTELTQHTKLSNLSTSLPGAWEAGGTLGVNQADEGSMNNRAFNDKWCSPMVIVPKKDWSLHRFPQARCPIYVWCIQHAKSRWSAGEDWKSPI